MESDPGDAVLRAQALRQQEDAEDRDRETDRRGEEHGQTQIDRGEQTADGGTDHGADAGQCAEEAEALRALLGRRDVGQVGEQGGKVPGRQPLDDTGEHEHPDRPAHAEQRHREGRAERRDDDDGSSSEPIGEAAEERCGEEGAQPVDRFQHADPESEVVFVRDVLQHDERQDGEDDGHADDREHRQDDEHDPGAAGAANGKMR